jgi:hypothetical protein
LRAPPGVPSRWPLTAGVADSIGTMSARVPSGLNGKTGDQDELDTDQREILG